MGLTYFHRIFYSARITGTDVLLLRIYRLSTAKGEQNMTLYSLLLIHQLIETAEVTRQLCIVAVSHKKPGVRRTDYYSV